MSCTGRYVKMDYFRHEWNKIWIMNGNTKHIYTTTVHFLAEYTTAHVNFGMELINWDNGNNGPSYTKKSYSRVHGRLFDPVMMHGYWR